MFESRGTDDSRMIIHVAAAIGKDLEEKMRIEIEEICWFVCSFV